MGEKLFLKVSPPLDPWPWRLAAIRRIDGGGLTDEEIERLGFTLMRQSEEIAKIAREFGLESDDLNLDLGPLGKLL